NHLDAGRRLGLPAGEAADRMTVAGQAPGQARADVSRDARDQNVHLGSDTRPAPRSGSHNTTVTKLRKMRQVLRSPPKIPAVCRDLHLIRSCCVFRESALHESVGHALMLGDGSKTQTEEVM